MTEKQSYWKSAHAQAKNIKKLKSPAAKKRQVALWLEAIKRALKGGA